MKPLLAAALALIAASGPVLAGDAAPAQPPTSAPSLEGMVGPGLFVSDHERSLKFYTEGLGLALRMRFGPKDRPDMVVGFGRNPMDAGIMLLTDKQEKNPAASSMATGSTVSPCG